MSQIKFAELLQEGKSLWPESVFIGDGQLLDNEGFVSDSLVNIWDKAEQMQEKKYPNDLWHELIVWSIYRTVHRTAIDMYSKGQRSFNINDIANNEFEIDFKAVIKESVPVENQKDCFF